MISYTSKCYSLLFVLGLSIILYSCKQRSEIQKDIVVLSNLTSTSVFDIFSDVHLVQLESKSDELIGIISKVIFHKGAYYMQDAKTRKIWCFDEKGAFLHKIHSQGRGPGEFTDLTDFTIDRENNRIFVLDAPMHRILSYDLNGEHLKDWVISTEKIMGFNKVFILSDSMLLITSITNEQLVFFNILENKVEHKKFSQDVSLRALASFDNVYQFDNRTFALPSLSQQVYDITLINATPHYQWNFGKYNNSDRQIEMLLEEIKNRNEARDYIIHLYEVIGKDKQLQHHILRVFESVRYYIALVEFDNNWRNVFVDKLSGEIHVFDHFRELISLGFSSYQEDRVISFDSGGIKDRIKASGDLNYQHRVADTFNPDILSENDQHIIKNHNPITDNPFLVVYKFKE